MDVFSLDLTILLLTVGLCVRAGRGVDLALHPHAFANRNPDCRVRFDRTGYSVWKLRHALEWAKLWPFMLGAAIGVSVGTAILGWANPVHVRVAGHQGFGIG